jgi:hypothetical protein
VNPKELASAVVCCQNRPAEEGCEEAGVRAKEKGVARVGAGATAGVSFHCVLHSGQALRPETHRRWNVWAHSDVNKACAC